MNRKGSKYFTIWWFVCWAFVLGGLVISASRFQNIIDVSSMDADLLASRVTDCIVDKGKLNFDINKEPDVFSLCKFAFREEKSYFLGIEVYNTTNCKEVPENEEGFEIECCPALKKYYFGSERLQDRCINLEGIKTTYMPDCKYKYVYATGQNEINYMIKIIGGTDER